MELKVGYWNIQKKQSDVIVPFILDLLKEKELDVLFLSEFDNLNVDFESTYLLPNYRIVNKSPVCEKVMAIQNAGLDFEVRTEDRYYVTITSKIFECMIVGLHLKDNVNDSKANLDRLKQIASIMEASKKLNYSKRVFVGDFNCMPYDDELIDFDYLHAVLFKTEMKTNADSREKHYNPMLLALSEEKQQYGSLRYTSGNHSLYWYAFDQVIVSEILMESICEVEYLKSISGNSLMSPRGSSPQVSDHLPLVFKIKE